MRLIGLNQCFQGVDQGVQSERLISPVLVGNEGATRKISRGRPPTLDPLSPPYPSQPQPHAPPLTQRLGHIIQLVLGAADQHHGESSASQLQYSTMSLTHTDKQPHSASVCVRQTDKETEGERERVHLFCVGLSNPVRGSGHNCRTGKRGSEVRSCCTERGPAHLVNHQGAEDGG